MEECSPTSALCARDDSDIGASYPNLASLEPLPDRPWAEIPIPELPPKLQTGTLVNGLSYYVLPNQQPRHRAEVHLVVGFGSLSEEEDQRGGAHILEHLGFSATKNFENHEIVRFLESIGATFGACQNAYTSFDRTVYHLQVASDDWEVLSKSLSVLREFAFSTRISEEDLDRERHVVLDEWRQSKSATGRLMESYTKAISKGSLYEVRLPIGLETVIRGCRAERLRDYYRQFYHPQRMAVIAVGDFEVDRVASLIRELFDVPVEEICRAPTAPERPNPEVPMQSEPRFVLSEDPELAMSVALVEHLRPRRPPPTTVADFEQLLVERLFLKVLNSRLFKLTMRKDSIIFSASITLSVFCPTLEGLQVSISPAEGRIPDALFQVLVEVERVKRFGFRDEELRRARLGLLAEFEEAYIERDQTDSGDHASELATAFLESQPAPGAEFEGRVARAALRGGPGAAIDAARVAAVSASFDPWGNTVYKICAPRRSSAIGAMLRRQRPLQEADVRDALERLRAAADTLEPWPEDTDDVGTRLRRRFKRAREEAPPDCPPAASPPGAAAGVACGSADCCPSSSSRSGGASGLEGARFVRQLQLGEAFGRADGSGCTAAGAPRPSLGTSPSPSSDGDGAGLAAGQPLGEELSLRNGIRVFLRRSDTYDDEVLLRCERWGGLSDALESDGILCEALYATAVVSELDLYGLRPEELTECLEGLRVSPPSLSIGCYRSQVVGDCSPTDLETLLLLLHLLFACPVQPKPEHLETLMQIILERRQAEDRSPQHIYAKHCDKVNTRSHPFYRPCSVRRLKRLDFARACDIFNAKLRSPSDWTMVLIGKLPPTEDVLTLLDKYVATIPARPEPPDSAHAVVRAMAQSSGPETVTNVQVGFPLATISWEQVRVPMVDPQCRVLVSFPITLELSTEEEPFSELDQVLALGQVWRLVETKLCERLRFELGKTYKVSIGDSFDASPPMRSIPRTGTVSVNFGCDPSDAQGLLNQVLGELERLREAGFEQREVDAVREQERRSIQKALRENTFWESTLVNLYFSRSFPASGCDIGCAVENWKSRYDASLQRLSPESALRALLRALPRDGVHTAIVMWPTPPAHCSVQ